jgi:phage shock protein A
METLLRQATPAALRPGPARTQPQPPARIGAPDVQSDSQAPASAAPRRAVAPRRGLSAANDRLQDDVARAQQALDYLDRMAGQLEALKGQLAAKLSGARADERQLESRLRELASSMAARRSGGGVDANLDFSAAPAAQRFRIRELDIDSLQQGAPQNIAFSVGGAGGPQLSARIEPGMSGSDIAATLDRTLAPLKVRAQLDQRGQLVFSTGEENFATVRDTIAVSGRGRVTAEPLAPQLDPQRLDVGNPDALRQSLREVVQALARVRRAQDAASAALSAASTRAAQAGAAARAADAAQHAQEFVQAAANPDYDSLIAMSSALVGVSRERVLALLGLR